MKRRSMLTALACAAASAPWGAAIANAWPNRTLRVIVPFPAGGAGDLVPRIIGERLEKMWQQPVIVENRTGADGIIGMNAVAKAPGDGYTLGVASSGPVVIGKRLFPQLPFDPNKDLKPVSLTYETPFVLIVRTSAPWKTLEEVITAARKAPGQINIAIPNRGSIQHLLTEQMKGDAGVEMANIPYKGGGPAALAVASGEVDMTWGALPNVVGLVQGGRVRAIAVSSAQRARLLPDVATVGEQGQRQWTCANWNGLVMPGDTPSAIVATANAAITQALREPAVVQRFREMGVDPLGGTPERFAQLLREEGVRWARVIDARGIKPE
ncbi:Bug family tripartite tricarboxylate transporter substrate binding protein [Hydrogenophaga sp. BPS33]|uniref:Bug family tripartite tricarboxylate transporter substrate binding protein n=1 Tax=Hydrogenophaga sp. BPS33 TaxID=2651974 RepID=UPI00131F8E41|nr:tripartite tricarboxylate transporter substrate binding protein [Hydrogenophaga sp. BPS33]QHE85028.1 tripartite tricarboxylate transporter substrate binding protein [Hydrogenophaga sp. BPS33]